MAREVNLVPDVKNEMLKALKIRNYTLFVCIIVAIASVSVTLIFWLIMNGQQAALTGKKTTLDAMSSKLNSYGDLDEFLTIKDQLGNISGITGNKKVVSRTFDILPVLIPAGPDTINISELKVDLSTEQPTLDIDAQANAGEEPDIDYRVLEAFKKSMQFMRYDYGRYVDKNGATIPSYCMIEKDIDGSVFNDPEKGIFAYWTINAEGCNPSPDVKSEEYPPTEIVPYRVGKNIKTEAAVKIWRNPQLSEWYAQGKADLSGQVTGIEHFESACITYSGNIPSGSNTPTWATPSNENCRLVPTNSEGESGITISDSSDGKTESGDLVLRFSATISIDPEVYKFTNTHMLAFPPDSRRNVTDSYVQIQSIFKKRAEDCKETDTECNTNTKEGN